MIKVMLFDVDGVVANGESFGVHLKRDYGLTPEQVAPFFRESFLLCLLGQADLKESLQPYLVQWGWQQPVQAFLDYWFACEHVVDQSLIAYVQPFRQQGIPCYLATQQEQYRAEYIMHNMGLRHSFDGIFSSADLHLLKTDPAFFRTILQRLPGIQASEILFWDDAERNVLAAREAGLCAEVYTAATFQYVIEQYAFAS